MKRTVFYHQELQAGAKMRVAQGWEMPDHFGDPRAEHLAVRSNAGVFDWASTGEIEIQGCDALALVQKVIVNDASRIPVGRVLYTTMCLPTGAILSDVTIYRLGEDRYWCMTAWGSNQAGQRPEYEWLLEQARWPRCVRHGCIVGRGAARRARPTGASHRVAARPGRSRGAALHVVHGNDAGRRAARADLPHGLHRRTGL